MHHLHNEKKGLRGLAIAESFHNKETFSNLAGVVMRRNFIIDGFVFGKTTLEGNDSTEAILQMYYRLKRNDISFVMISGVIISMYNIVDIKKIWNELKIPVVGITYEDSDGIESAIKRHFPEKYQFKLNEYHKIGKRTRFTLHTNHDLFVRFEGCTSNEVQTLLDNFTIQGSIPEPIRAAQLLSKTKN